MKKIIGIIIGCYLSGSAFSQTCTNCGIATNIPKSKLEIRGCGTDSTTSSFRSTRGDSVAVLFVRDDKRVGINTLYPKNTLHIETSGSGGINLVSYSGSPSVSYMVNSTTTPSFMMGVDNSDSRFKIGTTALGSTSNRFTIDPTNANVGIGTNAPTASSILDLTSTTKGFLPPRMTAANRRAIASPAAGLVVYQNAGQSGLYFYNGAWQMLCYANVDGSSNTICGDSALFNNSTGTSNTATGYKALFSTTSGSQNTANGPFALYSNNSGSYNTSSGYGSLFSNTNGYENCGYGNGTLHYNSTGVDNTASGVYALWAANASWNTAFGAYSLNKDVSGANNTAIGFQSLFANINGSYNCAVGVNALNNDTSSYNTAVGYTAMFSNTKGANNSALGMQALYYNTTGNNNTSLGFNSLFNNSSGYANTAIGSNALASNTAAIGNSAGGNYALYKSYGSYNTAFGDSALITNTSGGQNTALGGKADISTATFSNCTAIGYGASATVDKTMEFGNSAVLGWGFGAAAPTTGSAGSKVFIVGTTGTTGNGAYLSGGGTWTNVSDRNKKEHFVPVNGMELLSKICELPIQRWNYKGEQTSAQHIGPMAQDFYRLFQVGNDSLGISTIDPAGIALSGIQELAKQNKKLEKENAELKAHLEELAAALLAQKTAQARSEKQIEYLNKRFELLTETVVPNQK